MRADRLVSIILILQRRGRGSASQLVRELAAVFLLDRSPAVGSLGLGRHLSSALMKISAELPERTLERVEWFRQRILIEAIDVSDGAADHGALPLLQEAVIQSKRIEFELRWPRPGQSGRYAADPLGLVAAAEDWYLVAGIECFARAYPLSMIRDVVITRYPSMRPPDFVLAAF